MTAPLGQYLARPPRYGIGAAATAFQPDLPVYIRITDIDEYSRFNPDPIVSVDSPLSSNYLLRDGDIVVARTGASVGKSYRYRRSDGDLVFAGFLIAVRPDSKRLDPRYLEYTLQSKRYWDWVTSESMRSGQPGINAQQIARLEIDAPEIEVQREVADKLDDVDNLIGSLERLIAKRCSIKQGMMQELLTGQTRLAGFTDSWRQVRLGDVLTVRHGKSQRGVEDSTGAFPILATGGQIGWARMPLYSRPSVLIGRKGTIDRPQYQDSPFWTVDTLFYTEVKAAADPRFLYYVFLTVDWRSMNEASGVPSLSSTRVESVEVKLPSKAEQIAIRRVLDDVDNEVSLLERRLESARAIKTGMMQELLTGRTRLPVEAAS